MRSKLTIKLNLIWFDFSPWLGFYLPNDSFNILFASSNLVLFAVHVWFFVLSLYFEFIILSKFSCLCLTWFSYILFYKFLLYLVKSLNSCLWLIWLCSGVSCSDPDLLFWFWWKIVSAIGKKTKNIHKSKFVVRHLRMTETSKKITRIFFFWDCNPNIQLMISKHILYLFLFSVAETRLHGFWPLFHPEQRFAFGLVQPASESYIWGLFTVIIVNTDIRLSLI